MKTAQGLVQYAQAQLGMKYWYGCYGQRPTAELADYKHGQYPDQMTTERVAYAKAHHLSASRVFDCAGLIKGYLWSETPTGPPKYNGDQDKSAGGMRNACKIKGHISSIPEQPGVLVFIGTRHVGVYVGGGKVVEAKGFNYGVVETELKKGAWDGWGKCPWIDYGDVPQDAPKPCAKPVSALEGAFEHTVKSGDTLWALASRYLGSGYRWTEIQALNGGIDPRKLRIGMVLKIPARGCKK